MGGVAGGGGVLLSDQQKDTGGDVHVLVSVFSGRTSMKNLYVPAECFFGMCVFVCVSGLYELLK